MVLMPASRVELQHVHPAFVVAQTYAAGSLPSGFSAGGGGVGLAVGVRNLTEGGRSARSFRWIDCAAAAAAAAVSATSHENIGPLARQAATCLGMCVETGPRQANLVPDIQ